MEHSPMRLPWNTGEEAIFRGELTRSLVLLPSSCILRTRAHIITPTVRLYER